MIIFLDLIDRNPFETLNEGDLFPAIVVVAVFDRSTQAGSRQHLAPKKAFEFLCYYRFQEGEKPGSGARQQNSVRPTSTLFASTMSRVATCRRLPPRTPELKFSAGSYYVAMFVETLQTCGKSTHHVQTCCTMDEGDVAAIRD